MSIPVALLLPAGAFALTVTSSVVLARELDRIGERLGFSEALLGIVTALGADAPRRSHPPSPPSSPGTRTPVWVSSSARMCSTSPRFLESRR